MADSVSLSDTPSFNDPYIEDIYSQVASFALVFQVFLFLSPFIIGVFSGCGYKGADTLQCLRSAPSEALIRAGYLATAARTSTLYLFAPILDGELLKIRPIESFKAGIFAHVPVLVGSVSYFIPETITLTLYLAARIPTKAPDGLQLFQTSQLIRQRRMPPKIPSSTSYKVNTMASMKIQSNRRWSTCIRWTNTITP